MLGADPRVRVAGRRPVRLRAHRQRAHRHRAGVPGQADARPARGAQRADGPGRCATATVVEIAVEDVVLDDLLELRTGDQVPADGTVHSSDGLELDESLLTGESDPIVKQPGDEVLSGAIVVAGSGRFQATAVGDDAYAAQARGRGPPVHGHPLRARRRHQPDPEVRDLGARSSSARCCSCASSRTRACSNAITGAVAGRRADGARGPGAADEHLVRARRGDAGPAPGARAGAARGRGAGPGRRRVPRQDRHADRGDRRVRPDRARSTRTSTSDGRGRARGDRATTRAATRPRTRSPARSRRRRAGRATGSVPFSSARKWSAASYGDHGTWVLGAPEMVWLDASTRPGTRPTSSPRPATGCCSWPGPRRSHGEELPAGPAAGRARAARGEGAPGRGRDARVLPPSRASQLKVISGDNPRTVGAVARRVGLPDAGEPVDARELPEDIDELAEVLEHHSVFGRVTPQQKRAMVKALQSRGHVVAMTGDGVNDALALKDADIGVAMGSGAAATRAVAQLVLLDSEFSTLPGVVAEGRRVIANIERVSNLFLTKTTYAALLAIVTVIVGWPYPFLPRQSTIVNGLTIGIPAFFLALAPEHAALHPRLRPTGAALRDPGRRSIVATAVVDRATRSRAPKTSAPARRGPRRRSCSWCSGSTCWRSSPGRSRAYRAGAAARDDRAVPRRAR